MTQRPDDARWMAVAIALAQRGRARSTPNPNVGCVIVRNGHVIARGWTQAGGRPHAEQMALAALAQAGESAHGSTLYSTLEPCAHQTIYCSSCADSVIDAGVSRVIAGILDPDPRTAGAGMARIAAAGVDTTAGVLAAEARASMAGWLSQMERGRPHITLKLATSLDGCIALADGTSRWITGDAARAHGHMQRAQSDAIVVGRGTYDADAPRLDVRLPGLEARSPRRFLLTTSAVPDGWEQLSSPDGVHSMPGVQHLLIEGGAGAAAAFVRSGLVDRIVHYQAPVLLGGGRAALGDIGLANLGEAHDQWVRVDHRPLGKDMLSVYDRV